MTSEEIEKEYDRMVAELGVTVIWDTWNITYMVTYCTTTFVGLFGEDIYEYKCTCKCKRNKQIRPWLHLQGCTLAVVSSVRVAFSDNTRASAIVKLMDILTVLKHSKHI